VDEGWNEVLGCLWSTMNHQERKDDWICSRREEEVLGKMQETNAELR